jgi:hypothetical protein
MLRAVLPFGQRQRQQKITKTVPLKEMMIRKSFAKADY